MKRHLMLSLLLISAALFAAAEKLTVIGTTDIHGQLFSGKDKPNLLKLVRAVSDEVAAVGKTNSLVIDCGDLIQGSAETWLDRGKSVIALLNAAGYDVWVPGNHDFEFGMDTLLARGKEFKGDLLCGNLVYRGKAPVAAWKLYERAGVKVAVIGITSDHIASWNWRPEESGVEIPDTLSALDRVMPEVMRAKPDVILLAIHAGRFQSKRFGSNWQMADLARRYPQIDLILGGHTHEPVAGIPMAKSWFAQAGKHAQGYVKAEIEYDRKRKKLLSLRSSYHTPGADSTGFEADKTMKRRHADLRKNLYSTVCENAPALTWKEPETLAQTFCSAIAEETKAPVVFHGVLSYGAKHAGRYTRKDVFDLCPFENTVVLMDLSPSECKAVLEEQRAAFRSKKKNAMPQFVKGVSLGDDGRLRLADGRVWDREGDRLPVAFNSFIASSAGMRFPVLREISRRPAVNGRDTGLKIRMLLENYLRRNYQ